MWNSKRSLSLSLGLCYLFSICALILMCFAPFIVSWYAGVREIEELSKFLTIILYLCCVLGLLALFYLIRLLNNIRKEEIFTEENAGIVRKISWCCFGAFLVTFVSGFFYLPFLFIGISAGFMGLILRVVKNVLWAAAELKKDASLTI